MDMMRVAITGGTGLLGTALFQTLRKERPGWEVTVLSRHAPLDEGKSFWKPLDITDADSTFKTITKINPDVVIHAAAIRSPDACEKDPEGAFKVNFLGTRNVALACDCFDTELVFISSDQVFYGAQNRVHQEYDPVRAVNLYGETKILGEAFIREHLGRFWIVRTAKLFGGPNDHQSFMDHAYASLSNHQAIRVVKDWQAHMTHAVHFSEAIAELIEKKTYGIYHIVSPGVPSYLEIGEFVAKEMKRPRDLLQIVSQKELSLSAARASYLELSTKIWKLDFGHDIGDWKEGVREFLKERGYSR